MLNSTRQLSKSPRRSKFVGGVMALKEPKTDRSRRTITLPDRLVQELRAHRKEQLAWRLKLGMERMYAISFSRRGTVSCATRAISRKSSAVRSPLRSCRITFHGLWHTHITHLLRSACRCTWSPHGLAMRTQLSPIHVICFPANRKAPAPVIDAALRIALQD